MPGFQEAPQEKCSCGNTPLGRARHLPTVKDAPWHSRLARTECTARATSVRCPPAGSRTSPGSNPSSPSAAARLASKRPHCPGPQKDNPFSPDHPPHGPASSLHAGRLLPHRRLYPEPPPTFLLWPATHKVRDLGAGVRITWHHGHMPGEVTRPIPGHVGCERWTRTGHRTWERKPPLRTRALSRDLWDHVTAWVRRDFTWRAQRAAGVSFLQRAPQRLGLLTAGSAALTPAPSASPSARRQAAQPPDPARFPLRWPWCPWRPPVAPGGSRCSCCCSVRVGPGTGVCREGRDSKRSGGGAAGLGGLGDLRRGCFRGVGRSARGPGATRSEERRATSGSGGPASRPRTRRGPRGVGLEPAGRRLGYRIRLPRDGPGRIWGSQPGAQFCPRVAKGSVNSFSGVFSWKWFGWLRGLGKVFFVSLTYVQV